VWLTAFCDSICCLRHSTSYKLKRLEHRPFFFPAHHHRLYASITTISACVAIHGGNEQERFSLLRLPLLAPLDLGNRQRRSNIQLISPCVLGLMVARTRKEGEEEEEWRSEEAAGVEAASEEAASAVSAIAPGLGDN